MDREKCHQIKSKPSSLQFHHYLYYYFIFRLSIFFALSKYKNVIDMQNSYRTLSQFIMIKKAWDTAGVNLHEAYVRVSSDDRQNGEHGEEAAGHAPRHDDAPVSRRHFVRHDMPHAEAQHAYAQHRAVEERQHLQQAEQVTGQRWRGSAVFTRVKDAGLFQNLNSEKRVRAYKQLLKRNYRAYVFFKYFRSCFKYTLLRRKNPCSTYLQ